MIIFLNKQDVLAEKIKSGRRLEDYFPDFARYTVSPAEIGKWRRPRALDPSDNDYFPRPFAAEEK